LAKIRIGMVGLPPDAAWKFPAELSGGMLKRSALARALALDPELLFLDEPTSGLDPVSAAAFDDLVLRLRDAMQLTILFVTHDLDSLWRIADRVLFLGRAKVLACGSVTEVADAEAEEVRQYFRGPRGRNAAEAAGG
jgi:phospholipid/cholesterol/gamma-HCH transport system ATP-binding protein